MSLYLIPPKAKIPHLVWDFNEKAGAIVADIGGVTCHAAVVSRKFGIPCIIGTGNATKIIKDGDILELHNLRGTVKIVKVQGPDI